MSKKNPFIWGTATASYQIEGAYDKDGKGESIWDRFAHQPGHILNGENGDVACNFYEMWQGDVDLLKKNNIQNFRLSISWPRLLPQGVGAINQAGVDFYDRLINCLLEADITPWVTMYHWDLPQALQDKGGWTNRDITSWFAEYADLLSKRYGDRVKNWMILNEPNVHAWFGHGLGFHAPGLKTEDSYLAAAHHQNLVIGDTARFMKQENKGYRVGSCYQLVSMRTVDPKTTEEKRIEMDHLWNKNFLDPLFKGVYPGAFQKRIQDAGLLQDGDAARMMAPLDFVGVQNYNPIYMAQNDQYIYGVFFGPVPEGAPKTDYDWPIDADGLREALVNFRNDYGDIPIIITENGAAFFDEVKESVCDDKRRIAYLTDYLAAVQTAKKQGVNVQGYFVWSFLDNFEWADGYKFRFGMVHVDYKNGCKRTPKESLKWFSQFIENKEFF